jgi:hypothetical protein
MEINSARETIREDTKISVKESLGYYELKKHKPCFDEEFPNIKRKKECGYRI